MPFFSSCFAGEIRPGVLEQIFVGGWVLEKMSCFPTGRVKSWFWAEGSKEADLSAEGS